MFGHWRRLRTGAVAIAATALLAAGCGSGGNDSGGNAAGGVEKSEIKIGMLPLPEVAPIQIAIDKGFFKAEGLNVKAEPVQGGAAAMPMLINGQYDILHSNYVSAIINAVKIGKIKVVGEAYVAKPDNFLLMAKKGSPITKVADLKGKKIGVNTRNNVATLTTDALLKINGLTKDDVTYLEKPFPDMVAALEGGLIDAAFLPEPFHQAAAAAGNVRIADVMSGPTADFPIAGYLTTEDFSAKNPKTVAAFQRALGKAAELAISNSDEVDAALGKYTKIDKATADLMKLGGFSTTVNPTRLQRVADLMLEHQLITAKFDVNGMIYSGGAK
jgi:NitT/TauT family transport system substrate-binding protein